MYKSAAKVMLTMFQQSL